MTHSLVIGGSRGLGRAVVGALVGRGDLVSVVSRGPGKDPVSPHHFPFDLHDPEGVAPLLERICERQGPLDHLIFSQRYRGQDWGEHLDTMLGATARILDAAVGHFQPQASVVALGSVSTLQVLPDQELAYHVGHGGLAQLVRFYATRLGPRGVRVNAVSTCRILKTEAREYYLSHPEEVARCAAITPLGRMGSAEEVAQAVLFLASPMASFITGQTLVVDGGASLGWKE